MVKLPRWHIEAWSDRDIAFGQPQKSVTKSRTRRARLQGLVFASSLSIQKGSRLRATASIQEVEHIGDTCRDKIPAKSFNSQNFATRGLSYDSAQLIRSCLMLGEPDQVRDDDNLLNADKLKIVFFSLSALHLFNRYRLSQISWLINICAA